MKLRSPSARCAEADSRVGLLAVRRLALGLATAALAIALSAALGEALVRALVGPPAQILYSGSFRDVQSDFDVVYGVTSEGRRRTCGPSPVANATRVAVIGDSFVFGQGVADCEDFVSLLNLRARDKRFLNFGIIASGVEDYRLIVRDLVADTDEVLIVFFGNDVPVAGLGRTPAGRAADRSSLVSLVRRARRAWILYRLREAARDPGGRIADFEGRPNQILSELRKSPDSLRAMVEPTPAEETAFRARFAELAGDLLERFGPGRVWISCAPDGQTVSRRLAEFIREQGGAVAPFGMPGRAYELVRELSHEHGLRFVDVFPGFVEGGDELYHPHDLHWAPAGHRRMAELLAGPLGLPAPAAAAAEAGEAPVISSAAR
jgi:lysophospholipase L1-like esterase